jgi:formate-dependent nitrite reductase membrane component NrfD
MSESEPTSKPLSASAVKDALDTKLRPALIAGCYTGAMLTITMLGALVLANRVPALEPYAFERNAGASALFGMIMLVPVLRFLNRPRKMFVAAMIGWGVLTAAYDFAGLYFHNLFNALQRTPFEVLVEGAIAYGVLAVAVWVGAMILHARRHSLAPVRRSRPRTVSSNR